MPRLRLPQFRSRRWRIVAVACAALLVAVVALAALGNQAARAPVESGGSTARSLGQPAAPPAATMAPALAAGSGGSAANVTLPNALPSSQRQIIKTGRLSLVVRDVDSAVAQARAIAQQYGGDVLQETNSKAGAGRIADLTLQVESARFDDAMAALRGLSGLVERRDDQTTSQDVTEEYVDVKAQVTNLEATERQLRALMDKATRTEDILAIQRELTNVRGQIDRLQGRLNYLERRSSFSTIVLHLEPVGAPSARPAWRFTEVLARAWRSSLIVLEGIATGAIFVGVFALWLVPLALLVWFVWRAVTRRTRPIAGPPAIPDHS